MKLALSAAFFAIMLLSQPVHAAEFSTSTDKKIYELGGIFDFTCNVPERLYEANNITQTPIVINVTNATHQWVPKIFPGKGLVCHTAFDLSTQLGFSEGMYKVQTTYGPYSETLHFAIGHQFTDQLYKIKESQTEPIPQTEKKFYIKSDKPKYSFGERALFTGYVDGYMVNSFYDIASVNMQIQDDTGKLVDAKYYDKKLTASKDAPSLYDFKAFPKFGKLRLSQDVKVDGLEPLKDGEFRFSLSMTELHFNKDQTYYAVATYGDHTVKTPFVLYDKFDKLEGAKWGVWLDKFTYAAGDTVVLEGLAPYAIGGTSSGTNYQSSVDADGKKKLIKTRSGSSGDNQYVTYTVTLPNGKAYQNQVKVEEGEFKIEYETPKYFGKGDWMIGNYQMEVEWSSHHKYFTFHVAK